MPVEAGDADPCFLLISQDETEVDVVGSFLVGNFWEVEDICWLGASGAVRGRASEGPVPVEAGGADPCSLLVSQDEIGVDAVGSFLVGKIS